MGRVSEIHRKTGETDVRIRLELDGSGRFTGDTGIGFFDHMLHLWTRHGNFDLDLSVTGDLMVDGHHTVEDTGIVLGEVFREALGDKRGIRRYGDIVLPMDETLVLCAVDLSGRPYLNWKVEIPAVKVGDFDTELAEEFMRAFCFSARINLHLLLLSGGNTHHIIEGCFKALARSLREAAGIDQGESGLPSTKGML